MRKAKLFGTVAIMVVLVSGGAMADQLDSQFDVNDFYRGFELSEITPANQQTWPYYRHVSTHWDDFALHGTATIAAAPNPTAIAVADADARLDLTSDWRDGRSFLDSLHDTQVKGFLVMKGNTILAEFYSGGFNIEQTQLLQSAAKSYAGLIAAKLVDAGLLDPKKTVAEYLDDFAGTSLGASTLQQVFDMTSGLGNVFDFHTPGAEGYLYEIEQGMKPGEAAGHRKLTREAKAEYEPGTIWAYNDKNTDTIAMLAEAVIDKPFAEQLSELFADFGATAAGSIALTSDGTTSPSYGISTTLRDYGLFHQWIAEGKAPKSFYASITDTEKDLLRAAEKAKLFPEITYYGTQTYYMPEHDVAFSFGSFGQLGFSDLKTGVSVVFLQDWATNAEIDKLHETMARALAVVDYLRMQAEEGVTRGRGL